MDGAILGYTALALSGLAALLTTSRLSLSVFIFLASWFLIDSSLMYLDAYYVYPALFIGITLDYGLLIWLSLTKIKCVITPIATAVSAMYAAICLVTEWFNIPIVLDYYGLVMGLTALFAAMEATRDGLYATRRNYSDIRRDSNFNQWVQIGVEGDQHPKDIL